MKKFSIVLIFLFFLLSGCTPPEEVKQISIEETQFAAVTNTPASTNTPAPTNTPTPTNTPQPTYTPMAKLALVNKVIRDISFDDISSIQFDINGDYDLKMGLLILNDPFNPGDPWADGSSYLYSHFTSVAGHGYLLLFRTLPDANFLITLEYGPFDDPSYRSLWLENVGRTYTVWSGKKAIVMRPNNIKDQQDTWYYLLFWVKFDGIEARLWEKDQTEITSIFKADTGTDWIKNDFHFVVHAIEGTVQIDEFKQFTVPVGWVGSFPTQH